MSRKFEMLCRRCLGVLSFACVIASAALLAHVFFVPVTVPVPELRVAAATQNTHASLENADARAAQLSGVKMSKTLITTTAGNGKPVPELGMLIRLVGVLSYGDPKDNEALIEILRTKQTRSYRAGDTIPEINATITRIDSAVILEYNGKQARLEVRNDERAESGQIATPNERSGVAAIETKLLGK